MSVSTRWVVFVLVVAGLFASLWLWHSHQTRPVIRIGVLHSLTGTMAISERPLVDALTLAIEEANAEGGINGQMIEAVVVDCRSDAAYCATQAERLITQEKVKALFGCWTSSCRKAVRKVVEAHNNLLFYPLQYEGMEISPNIIYTGAAPNQQIIPAVNWVLEHLGKRVYLAGSDYVFPRVANVIIKDLLVMRGATLVGERYLPLGSTNVDDMVADIVKLRPDVVLNTINGDSNSAFFTALNKAGVTPDKIAVLSFSLGEVEMTGRDAPMMAGHYAAWSYFQSIPSVQNQAFVERFHRRFGPQAVIDDPLESAYIGLKLWVQAAREAGSAEAALVQRLILDQTFSAPEGVVALDPATRHMWKMARIGKARRDGQFDILWGSGRAIEPNPFPRYRPQAEWAELLQAVPGFSP